MRALSLTILAAGLSLAIAAGAQAGVIITPPVPASSSSAYVTVASTEMTVTASSANLRQQPSTKAKILAKLTHGTKVQAVGTSGSWIHVKYKTMDGYVSQHLLR